jgi:hypothetical protein
MTAPGRIGLFLFVAIQLPFILFYIGLLVEKIRRPGFKNLNWEDFFWIGAVLLVFVLFDVWILKRIARRTQK